MGVLKLGLKFEEERQTIYFLIVLKTIEDVSVSRNVPEHQHINDPTYPFSSQPIEPTFEISLRRS